MSARSSTPALHLRDERPGITRTFLSLLAIVVVLVGSWAVLIGGVVLVVRAVS
jgi:hypothetical protein